MVAHAGGEELHSEVGEVLNSDVEEDFHAVVEEQGHPKGQNSIPRIHNSNILHWSIQHLEKLKSEYPEIASPSPSKIFRSDIASEYPCYRALF